MSKIDWWSARDWVVTWSKGGMTSEVRTKSWMEAYGHAVWLAETYHVRPLVWKSFSLIPVQEVS